MKNNRMYVLASIPGMIALSLEFFTKELLSGGLKPETFSILTKILWGITLISYAIIYLKNRKSPLGK